MMKPDPMPQPVLMNTVALRAVSMALRAGKLLASCASRPRSACGKGPAADGADGAGGAGGAAPICAAPLAGLGPGPSFAPATALDQRRRPQRRRAPIMAPFIMRALHGRTP